MAKSVQMLMLLKLCMIRKLEANYDLEQSAIFEEDKKQMKQVLLERKQCLEKISNLNKRIANHMEIMGVLTLKPNNNPLLYRIDRKIESSLRKIERKNAQNKIMLQYIAMNI